jgi:hypothetical protein
MHFYHVLESRAEDSSEGSISFRDIDRAIDDYIGGVGPSATVPRSIIPVSPLDNFTTKREEEENSKQNLFNFEHDKL